MLIGCGLRRKEGEEEIEKRPCPEVLREAMELLMDLGWSDIEYLDDSKQLIGEMKRRKQPTLSRWISLKTRLC